MGRLQDKRLFLLDMDGTIYLDDRLFDGVTAFLSRIREKGGRYLFLTNNSSKGVEGYIEKLNGMGIATGREDYLTSVDAAIDLLRAALARKLRTIVYCRSRRMTELVILFSLLRIT